MEPSCERSGHFVGQSGRSALRETKQLPWPGWRGEHAFCRTFSDLLRLSEPGVVQVLAMANRERIRSDRKFGWLATKRTSSSGSIRSVGLSGAQLTY